MRIKVLECVAVCALALIVGCGCGMSPLAAAADPVAPTEVAASTGVDQAAEDAGTPEDTNATPQETEDGLPADTVSVEAATPDTPSTLTEVDDTWLSYTNLALGFTLRVPQRVFVPYGACRWVETQGSYRTATAEVQTAVFETPDTAILSIASYAVLGDREVETLDNGGERATFGSCEMAGATLQSVTDPLATPKHQWAIQVADVADDAALLAFVQSRYGSGCRLGERTSTVQAGVFDIAVLGDGKELAESRCPVNFRVVVKVDDVHHRVAAWDLGQATTFAGDEAGTVVYDDEMVASFRFME